MAGLLGFLVHVVSELRTPVEERNGRRRVWGRVTRDLLTVYKQYACSKNRLPTCRLREAFNSLHLFPSNSQVYEMVQCAVECGSPCELDNISFGEFCVLVSELQTYYLRKPVTPQPRSMYRERSSSSPCKRWQHRVFLGGSCNPTSWRQDTAIPFFKQHGITFYNPQVQSWREELVELEARAKQGADILFFVIDNQTRAITSMIETAYLVATRRQVIAIIHEYDKNIKICGEEVPNSEVKDLLRGRQILVDLVERNSIPVFTSLNTALTCTQTALDKGLKIEELIVDDGVQPVLYGYLKVGTALLQMREAFNSMDSTGSCHISAKDVCLAYKSCTGGQILDLEWLSNHRNRSHDDQYNFEAFCCIVVEYQRKSKPFIEKLIQLFRCLLQKLTNHSIALNCSNVQEGRDIYLGGSCGDSNWRERIAVPLLRKHGLSYANPFVNDWEQRLIPIQVAIREKCRLLLYIISDRTRSISSMIEAGYYIGKGCKVVLCVKELPDDVTVGKEALSECAVKDYQRGRAYLIDLASREGVHLFDDVTEAVICAINYLKDGHM
ncbi:uncharacterized protein LOC110442397 [Mizuhopecten yessoensis]|uniref:Uncharacterized protein n=1 Tax=Mizuhopecten yessoensis TaxID=6573 RepID=A0A210R133_MIZYE|nr:uncharacterized protein LOC110442397 [Mizuhopecten yessoensis]OWF54682.1 hypothetical protein KP79_PYT04405 [Mizuhopecten yessoensis]